MCLSLGTGDCGERDKVSHEFTEKRSHVLVLT